MGEMVVKAQYPEDALLEEIDVRTFQLPIGWEFLIGGDQYIIDDEPAKSVMPFQEGDTSSALPPCTSKSLSTSKNRNR